MEHRRDDTALAEAIVAYLRAHPGAGDSLEGIAEWWVMRQVVRTEVRAVARVLERLAADGVLETLETSGGTHYRLRGDG